MQHSFSLAEKKGNLRLYGNKYNLSDIAAPAFIGRKQQHFSCAAAVKLTFQPAGENEEAGLTVYQNDKHHYDLALTERHGRSCLVVRKTVGDIMTEVCEEYITANPVYLRIRSDPEKYYFEYSYAEDKGYKTIAEGLSQLIATELASTFTGAVIAMYATGNGKTNTNPADFEWFEYLGILK